MFVCSTVSGLRFYKCCHLCLFMFRLGKFEVFDGDPGDKISLKLTGEHARYTLFLASQA